MDEENVFRMPEKRSTRRNSISAMFELPPFKKRKRKIDDDALSVQSLDISLTKKKSRRSILRVSSLVNLLSPSKSTSSKRFKVPPTPSRQNLSPYKAPQPSPEKRRLTTRTWSDMMADGGNHHTLTHKDIKRQEAIYELYQGEQDIIEDLNNVQKNYNESMAKLQLMTAGELKQIFGPIKSLPQVHEDLVSRLQKHRLPDGTTQGIGGEVLEWISSLDAYIEFCANQVFGKALLDEKKTDPAVDDFLERCQESPFSRKLDLWSLLDGARSRFVKYPLLIRSILKYTPEDHEDAGYLQEAIKLAEFYIAEADKKTGEAKCSYYQSRLTYIYDDQKLPEIDDSHSLICNGVLKNNKGSKLHLFLFDKVLVPTRVTNQYGSRMYQVYRQPIPVEDLVVEDLMETEIKMGSFRSAFSQSQTVRNVFKVSFKDSTKGQSHTLLANDEHDKRQWLQCFRQVTDEVHTIAPTHSDKRAA
ncbi:LOW QUALITY PROTEIN: neuroepithelial cell-transforming gene 1 protein-like [Haliotis rubra]|uniref:LOW QUALITY PROTEIN: neuroepithelial cell-transforming gene 1 protein-like n=1 Tax=Haliotis rubra TaxID=36100 RepID=UPI001EE5E883|nr:LOW QUALITY PROTEIN: neuroepithelial cell-transforming gene 1 protein-like [Haliotis rubra]